MIRDRDYPGNPLLSDLKFHQTYLSRILRDFEVTYYQKEMVHQVLTDPAGPHLSAANLESVRGTVKTRQIRIDANQTRKHV